MTDKYIHIQIYMYMLVCHRHPISRVVEARSHTAPRKVQVDPSCQHTLSHAVLIHATLSHATLSHGACISRHRWHPDNVR